MKITPLCVACTLMKRALELESLFGPKDPAAGLSVMRELMEAMDLYIGPDIEVAELATVSFRRAKSLVPDLAKLYSDVVERELAVASSRARSLAESLAEKPAAEAIPVLLRGAAVATAYKPFTGAQRVLEEPPTEYDIVNIRFGSDDTQRFLSVLEDLKRNGGSLYYLFASTAELPYDVALIERIIDEYAVKVYGVVRSKRYEDYVIADDISRLGADDLFEEIIEIEDAAAPLSDEDKHLIAALNQAELVIVKNDVQSLYFHNNPLATRTLYMFTSACPVLSRAFNVPERSVNIVLWEGAPRQG